jgi:hypothetical protein
LTRVWIRRMFASALLVGMAAAFSTAAASAAEGEGEAAGVQWRLEQPLPPPPPVGVAGSSIPIGLGHVGDLEFQSPNRGLLITHGNGSTISPGLWAYNGREWHELSTVCGATDGRIAWSGGEEFWTISDGRPGQASNPATGQPAPLADRTLCHFAHGEVVGSYASAAFQANSYQAMHALGCIGATDCWFAGDALPENRDGDAFHLHWNGGSLIAEPSRQGHAVEDMRLFEGRLYESVRLLSSDVDAEPEVPFPYALRAIDPSGASPFELVSGVPLYGETEFPQALDYLHLGADDEGLWAAAGPVSEPPAGSTPAPVTVGRYSGGAWTQILGRPESDPAGAGVIEGDVINSIAPEPGTDSAWIALDTREDAEQLSPTASATIARVSTDGTLETQTLPSPGETAEGIGPKGAAQSITCPAFNDCWMTTTQGWLFHLAPAGERQLAQDESSAFSKLITFRPPDEGLPQVTPDAPPPDDSGELPAALAKASLIEEPEATEAKVREALLSGIHTRLVHGTTLELRFHLAVEASVRLLAMRKKTVVASTPSRTFAGGSRKLLLRLNRRKWPTKLNLQTHALATLPLVGTRSPDINTVGTRVVTLPGWPSFGGLRSFTEPIPGSLP